jgi:hypothetical protein
MFFCQKQRKLVAVPAYRLAWMRQALTAVRFTNAPRQWPLIYSVDLMADLERSTLYNGAALSPRALDSFDASDAATITTAINPMISVHIALISGFTPRRTSE